ncbi:acetaldehyde dehydrogenase (acetylating) [Vagococcus sp.]|uniref:acetaldehyde dehydrogenase (acetylating) n=1 Tax=Vagococcus sp. TaxID=1933889 RepID=UPI003F95FCCE
MILDYEVANTTEVNDLIEKATKAQMEYAHFSQDAVDKIVTAVSKNLAQQSVSLAKLAHEETGFGNVIDKTTKNLFASETLYESIIDMKTVGIIEEDLEQKLMKVAVPLGIIAALVPSTNPTSTTIFKAMIALKTRNAIVLSPHPKALASITATVDFINEAAISAGAPANLVQVIAHPTLEGTQELMQHPKTALILATGGSAMVRAAYSSGNPAIGVGPGNTPVLIEKSANIEKTVDAIITSKTFDNGTICASEQALIVEQSIKEQVIKELIKQQAYFMNKDESKKVGAFIMRENGSMNPEIVGKPAIEIAKMSGFDVPKETKVLISEQTTISQDNPYSREKLSPILAMYTVQNYREGIEMSRTLLFNEGAGHTAVVHTENDKVVKEFGLVMPASRILVNTLAALGAIGGTTNLAPSLTLGCGAIGGSSLSENVHVAELINTNIIAYGVR